MCIIFVFPGKVIFSVMSVYLGVKTIYGFYKKEEPILMLLHRYFNMRNIRGMQQDELDPILRAYISSHLNTDNFNCFPFSKIPSKLYPSSSGYDLLTPCSCIFLRVYFRNK